MHLLLPLEECPGGRDAIVQQLELPGSPVQPLEGEGLGVRQLLLPLSGSLARHLDRGLRSEGLRSERWRSDEWRSDR